MDKRLFLASLAAACAAAPVAHAAPATLSGTVIYRERMMLPPQARLEVQLVDVSRADAPAITLARTVIRVRGGVSPFTLRYDSARIRPGMSYALQARISVGDRLLFISTTRHPAFQPTPPEILVTRVQGQPPEPEQATSPAGTWLAEDIRGGGVIDRLQSVLRLGADGRVSGSGGCNRITGRAVIKGDAISFGRIASTMMACAPAAMNQERKFLDALGEVKFWRVDAQRRKLHLLDGQKNPLIIFSRM